MGDGRHLFFGAVRSQSGRGWSRFRTDYTDCRTVHGCTGALADGPRRCHGSEGRGCPGALILWSEDESETWQRRVIVRLDLENIQNSLQRLFPTAELQVSDSGEVLLIQGLLRSTDQATQMRQYLEQMKIPYVDMTSVAGIQQGWESTP